MIALTFISQPHLRCIYGRRWYQAVFPLCQNRYLRITVP